MKIKALVTSALLLLLGHGAFAAPLVIDTIISPTSLPYGAGMGGTVALRYNEVGDAGDTVGTAQGVTNGTTQIFGTNTGNDALENVVGYVASVTGQRLGRGVSRALGANRPSRGSRIEISIPIPTPAIALS